MIPCADLRQWLNTQRLSWIPDADVGLAPQAKLVLNTEQAVAVGIVVSHVHAVALATPTPTPTPPLHMLLYGAAGVGKSVVIRDIVSQVGQERCRVVGTTGVAAFNVGGETIHRLLEFQRTKSSSQ